MIGDGLLARAARLVEPERAHSLALSAFRLRAKLLQRQPDPRLAVQSLGLSFPGPVGLAAGFDKNAEAPDAMLAAGFGFVEVGTVTPEPQPGNPRPRVFRLPSDQAVINRLGFNSDGHRVVGENLELRRGRGGIVGINVGANAVSPDRVSDYCLGVSRFARLASYLTINISSPNTADLRALQEGEQLEELLSRVMASRDEAANQIGRPVPLLIKIAPDLDDAGLSAVVDAVLRHGADGLVISNTTTARGGLKDRRFGQETGGLSGPPLFERSTAMLARARELSGPGLVLIGAGGVDSATAAWRKIAAGADLVQLYTGLVYQGLGLPDTINADLVKALDRRNLGRIEEARGIETARWAATWAKTNRGAEGTPNG